MNSIKKIIYMMDMGCGLKFSLTVGDSFHDKGTCDLIDLLVSEGKIGRKIEKKTEDYSVVEYYKTDMTDDFLETYRDLNNL
jgi:predicted mannosyl-3-phosphoglycerate phosphatase (HAD superfamily)